MFEKAKILHRVEPIGDPPGHPCDDPISEHTASERRRYGGCGQNYSETPRKKMEVALMDLQKFIAVLKDYLAQQTPNYQDGDAESLLEMLFNVYTQFNGFNNEIIRQDFNDLYAAMNGKTLREMDEIIYPVCTLCRDHEKTGFQEGVKVGIRLAQEAHIV